MTRPGYLLFHLALVALSLAGVRWAWEVAKSHLPAEDAAREEARPSPGGGGGEQAPTSDGSGA